MAVFEDKKSSNDIKIDEVVASDVTPAVVRKISFSVSDVRFETKSECVKGRK